MPPSVPDRSAYEIQASEPQLPLDYCNLVCLLVVLVSNKHYSSSAAMIPAALGEYYWNGDTLLKPLHLFLANQIGRRESSDIALLFSENAPLNIL